MEKLVVGTSPHIRDPDDVPCIMWTVVIALLPAGVMGWYYFGLDALVVILLSVIAAVVTEFVIQKLRGVEVTIGDGSAVVTGLLLAFVLPPKAPWFIPVVGSAFAVAIAKHAFGGLGRNIWNPALAGRAFVLSAWAPYMTAKWSEPVNGFFKWCATDATTQATPLDFVKNGGSSSFTLKALILGNTSGCLGETCAVVLIIGGLFLLYRGYIDWRIPIPFIVTVAVLGALFPYKTGAATEMARDPLFHIFSGGVILGAFFMATDMVTTPVTKKGMLVFGFGCGLLTVLIRKFGGYPEGVCYSILLMNTTTPLIDRFTQPRVFGEVSNE